MCAICAPARAAAEPSGQARPPVVLLLHGGGFIFDDASGMPVAAKLAEAAGFEASYVDYPEYDLRGAVAAARSAARRLRAAGRTVYAYGDSAGGTLAALLAERDLVVATATYSPVANLRLFADSMDDPDLYRSLIGADNRLLIRHSPGRHDSDRPILAMNPVDDEPWISEPIGRWDARDPEVVSIRVPGGHLGDESDPAVYRENAKRAMAWLARRHYTS